MTTPTPARRPAETGSLAGAAAILVGRLVGIDDPNTLVALTVILGFVPAAITWLVTLRRGA